MSRQQRKILWLDPDRLDDLKVISHRNRLTMRAQVEEWIVAARPKRGRKRRRTVKTQAPATKPSW